MADDVALTALPSGWNLRGELTEARPGNLFPSGIGFHAARADEDRLVPSVNALLRRGYRVRPLEIVRVPKGDRSTRPAADMPVTDQLIYGAFVRTLRSRLYPGLVTLTGGETDSEYRAFEEFPFSQRGVKYVLMADAAAFYEYVDHDLLAYELIGATGESELTESLTSMLELWMRGPRSLPQGPIPSGALSDIYISPVERSLSRAGFRFSRYSDDFRIVAGSWAEARHAQLTLETGMREIGLSVAPGKLFTPRLQKYRQMLDAARSQEELPVTSDADTTVAADDYSGAEFGPIEASEAERVHAEQIIGRVASEMKSDAVNTRLLRWALPRAAHSGSVAGLDVLNTLLRRHGHLTQTIAQYLRALVQTGPSDRALDAIGKWLQGDSYRYPWQVGWVLHATCFASDRDPHIARIARDILFDGGSPWFARGQAALSLAIHGRLPTQTDYVGTYELSPDATRPDLIAAVIIGQPAWGLGFLKGVASSPLERATVRLEPREYVSWLR